MAIQSFPVPSNLISIIILVVFSWKNIKQGHEFDLKQIMQMRHQIVGKYQNEMPKVARKAFTIGEIWNHYVAMATTLWNEKRYLKIVNSIFLLVQSACLCIKIA